MAFTFDGKDHMNGKGTLEDYFSAETWAAPGEENPTGNVIDELCLELFSKMSGVDPKSTFRLQWVDYGNAVDYTSIETSEGLLMVCIQPDDPIMGLWQDGKPIAAFYASYRGIYQAGGYVATTGQQFFASDFAEEPHNKWIERGATCADIAQDYLLNIGQEHRVESDEDDF